MIARTGWTFRSIWLDSRGSVAVVFSLSLLLLIGVVGLALDHGNSVRTKTHLQSALDAAVLAASNPALSDKDRDGVFRTSFKANYGTKFDFPSKLSFSYSFEEGGSGSGSMTVRTTFMNALGQPGVAISATSTAKSSLNDLEVVLALDVSGSMIRSDLGGGTRIQALKASANKMVDIILAAKTAKQSVKFGLVPFNMAVNIGTEHASLVNNTNHALFKGTVWGGCVLERPGADASTDDYTPGSSRAGNWWAHIWPPEPNTYPPGEKASYNPSDGTNSGYASVEPAPLGENTFKRGPNFNCPRYPIVRLTDSESKIRGAINKLQSWSNMGTTIGPAVGWALRVLSPTGPFKDGAKFSKSTKKVLVVVTDGELVTDGWASAGTNSIQAYRFNPASFGLDGRVVKKAPKDTSFTPYGYLVDSDPYNQGLSTTADAGKELDRLSLVACNIAKNRSSDYPIEIFTIALSVDAGPGTRGETLLSACASSKDHYIYADSSASLETAFKKIAERITTLRLTK